MAFYGFHLLSLPTIEKFLSKPKTREEITEIAEKEKKIPTSRIWFVRNSILLEINVFSLTESVEVRLIRSTKPLKPNARKNC